MYLTKKLKFQVKVFILIKIKSQVRVLNQLNFKMIQKDSNNLPDTLQTPFRYLPDTLKTLSRHSKHPPDSFQTPSRHPPDTLQISSRHPLNTHKRHPVNLSFLAFMEVTVLAQSEHYIATLGLHLGFSAKLKI